MRLACLTLIALFLVLTPLAGLVQAKGQPYKIAILEFDPVTDEAAKENLGRLTAEFCITAAVNSGSFSVVERAALKKVIDEMQFGAGSKAPGTAAQAIGAMVGAQGVLTGSVAKTGGSVRLDARLIDVVGGQILAARNAYAKADLRSLAVAAELLIGQLEGDLAKQAQNAKPADAPKPAESAKQADTAKPAEPTKPADVSKPAEAAKPADQAKPAEQAQQPQANPSQTGESETKSGSSQ
ncbi:hypothetical protein JCM15519_25470 [Fundidesulfovibrio butyratiphilus]